MNPRVVRALILVSTVVLAGAVLTLGSNFADVQLEVGAPAEREYRAQTSEEVVDQLLTEQLREQAAAAVEPVTKEDETAEEQVFTNIEELMAAVRAGVPGPERLEPTPVPDPVPETTTTSGPTTTTADTTLPAGQVTTTTAPTTTTTEPEPGQAILELTLFADVNGDGLFGPEPEEGVWRGDFGLENVRVVVGNSTEQAIAVGETGSDGRVVLTVPEGQYVVSVDRNDRDYPSDFLPSTGAVSQIVDCRDGECGVETIGLAPNARPADVQVADLLDVFVIPEQTAATLVRLGTQDLVRDAADEPLALDTVELEANKESAELFADGITAQNLTAVKQRTRSDPPFFTIDDRRDDDARQAVAEIIITNLLPNRVPDDAATEALRAEAGAAVRDQTRTVVAGSLIAAPGDTLDQFMVDAIEQTRAATGAPIREYGVVTMVAVLVGVLGFYLARFRPQFWQRPRMVALWGLLLVMAAGSVRMTLAFEDRSSWFVLPAVAFGYLAAVLFDNRMGTLMALAMAIITAIGTRDAGVTVYATLAALAPIGFVSRVSSRRAFRNSVLISASVVAAIAGAVTWAFHSNPQQSAWNDVGTSVLWAFGVSLLASLVALAAMPFFEAAFDITTTLRLLELTDRNHEALQMLQEKAFGTFNHSLMVGTLADTAARAIGANNLLARAAAYYHDLGKSENPTYYIENQFGIPNPHDDLSPEESAEIIRRHVTDGMALARRYRIPSEVADGILAHHGDAIMRYFYEKARRLHGNENLDPDAYRHAGHKPESQEMAIVMMADSVEGACRAAFGDEEPTPDAISKVVNRVIDEKVADGQLNESDLTLAELTKVRNAFIGALIGHYHQRIPYPNFPGS